MHVNKPSSSPSCHMDPEYQKSTCKVPTDCRAAAMPRGGELPGTPTLCQYKTYITYMVILGCHQISGLKLQIRTQMSFKISTAVCEAKSQSE